MRPSSGYVVLLAGIATLLGILAVGGTVAGVPVDMTEITAPEMVYVSENVSVSYRVVLDGFTWEDINVVGVTLTDGFPGEFYNHTRDPNAVTAPPNFKNLYSITIQAPDSAASKEIWGFLNLKGFATDYIERLGYLDVKATPVVRFAGSLGWNLVGAQHEIRWTIVNADATEIEETSIYWDTATHAGEDPDKANYPNRSSVYAHELHSPYYVNITLPEEPVGVHIIVHALINGRDFYDPVQRSIGVVALPEFEVTALHAGFKGRTATINWSIPTVGGAYIEETTIYWDTVSHAGAIDKANYANHADLLLGSDTRSYGVMLTLPDTDGTVYFVVNCVIKLYGLDFYSEGEHTIALRDVPEVTVTQYPEATFVGADASFVWTVSAEAEDVAETAIHWDTASHAGVLDVDAYPHRSVWMIGEEDGTYDVTFEVPDEPGTLYFIAHALVLGEDFYVASELQITIRDLPTISFVQVPDEAFVGDLVTVTVEVAGVEATEDVITTVHWDTESHPDAGPVEYSDHSTPSQGTGHGTHTHDIMMPATNVTLYLRASLEVQGVMVVSDGEVTISVKLLPSVPDVNAPEKVSGGKKAMVTFTLADVDDPEKVEVLWDTGSHDDTADYPNSVEATDNGDGTWTVEFKVPNKDGQVYYRVHVEDGGEDVYTDEASFKTKEKVEDSPGYSIILVIVALAAMSALIASGRRT